MDLKIFVKHQKLIKEDNKSFLDKKSNHVKLILNFLTDDWRDTKKYIFLKKDGKEYRFRYKIDGIHIPLDVIESLKFTISVYGIRNNYRITTEELEIRFIESDCMEIKNPCRSDGDALFIFYDLLNEKLNKSEANQIFKQYNKIITKMNKTLKNKADVLDLQELIENSTNSQNHMTESDIQLLIDGLKELERELEGE